VATILKTIVGSENDKKRTIVSVTIAIYNGSFERAPVSSSILQYHMELDQVEPEESGFISSLFGGFLT
jgi:hypothetical protein